VLCKISRSEDDVSQRLKTLFDKAIPPSADEMQRARDRKERGNPPGKQKDTLGDQITWEQLLNRCKGMNRLWIITDDRDYCIRHGKLVLLNSLLHRDLIVTCGVGLEFHCCTDLLEGITEFRKSVGVTADKLPTEQEATEIKKEIEGLPPPAPEWMSTSTDAGWWAAHRAIQQQRHEAFLKAASLYYFSEPGSLTPGPSYPSPSTTSTLVQPTQGTIKTTGD
jgi:hypothetical protein